MESSTTASSSGSTETIDYYEDFEYVGAVFLGLAGILTLGSILFLLSFQKMKTTRDYSDTFIHGHFIALLSANALQGVGSLMNFKWVADGAVSDGVYCASQGGIKQTGNLGTALMSLSISIHLFFLLYLRKSIQKVYFYSILAIIWTCIILVVIIGPTVIQKPELGPYFGISGSWCWITASYPSERIYLEYFFEFLSAGLCFLLYLTLLLRVRGNLAKVDGRWTMRTVSKAERWQLSASRDLLDSSMLNVAKCMLWFPVVYTIVIVPIALARLSEFAGYDVPYAATIFTGVVFNLTGFFNVVLLLWARKAFPKAETIPHFSTRRKEVRASVARTGGLIPFTLQTSELAEEYNSLRHLQRMNSGSSTNSTAHLVQPGTSEVSNFPSRSPTSLIIASPPPSASAARSSSRPLSAGAVQRSGSTIISQE